MVRLEVTVHQVRQVHQEQMVQVGLQVLQEQVVLQVLMV
jgi:hypothetical protein